MSEQASAPPVHQVKVGNVKVAVWRNPSGACAVTTERVYKDDASDDWKSTTSFNRDDLPKLQLALGRAYEWIFDNG